MKHSTNNKACDQHWLVNGLKFSTVNLLKTLVAGAATSVLLVEAITWSISWYSERYPVVTDSEVRLAQTYRNNDGYRVCWEWSYEKSRQAELISLTSFGKTHAGNYISTHVGYGPNLEINSGGKKYVVPICVQIPDFSAKYMPIKFSTIAYFKTAGGLLNVREKSQPVEWDGRTEVISTQDFVPPVKDFN
jgi:hypothetical protein